MDPGEPWIATLFGSGDFWLLGVESDQASQDLQWFSKGWQRAPMNYGERGPIWHMRALLAPAGGEDWAILTPDLDVYVETMSARNVDFTDFHYCGINGANPTANTGCPGEKALV